MISGALAMAAGLKGHRDVHTIDELYMKMEKVTHRRSPEIVTDVSTDQFANSTQDSGA